MGPVESYAVQEQAETGHLTDGDRRNGRFDYLPPLGPPGWAWLRPLLEGRGWTFVRVGSDAAGLCLTVALIGLLPASLAPPDEGAALLWAYPFATLAFLAVRGLYRPDPYLALLDAVAQIAGAAAFAAMLVIALIEVTVPNASPAALVGPVWLVGTLALIGGHVCLESVRRHAREHRISGKPTIIVGAGRVGARLERRLREEPRLGLNPIGFVDSESGEEYGTSIESPVLGRPSELRSIIRATEAEHVLLTFLRAPDSAVLPLIRDCEALGVDVSVVPRFFETTNSRVVLKHIGGLPLFSFRRVDPKSWQFAIKHMLDRVAAALMLLAFAPLLTAIAVAVRLSSPGPILFRQTRIGRDDTEFEMLKFRTMRVSEGIEAIFETSPDQAPGGVEGVDRRTRVGSLLRRTSLDELPQLLNVLRGEMSLVGPRPERPEFVRHFGENTERYTDRHRVKSGISGWAQVHGLRGQTSVADRVEWDNYYIDNWSLWLDVKILLMTLVAFLSPSE